MKSYSTNLDNKRIGIIISVTSIVLFFILASFSIKIAEIESTKCIHPPGGQCPITAHIPSASYAGAALLVIIFILGIKISLKSAASEKMRKELGDKAKML